MPIQKARFTPPPARAPLRQRDVEIPVQGGLHSGIPHQNLLPGFSPDLRNLVPEYDGYVTPRSGLSQFGSYDFNGAVLGAFETFDTEGNLGGVATSALSASFLHPDVQAWSALSYIAGSLSWFNGNLSGLSTDYFQAETVYDDNLASMICIFSNNTDSFKFFSVNSSSATFSDFTWPDSIASTIAAKDLASVNDRLVFFNTLDSSGVRYPTRVMASARGNPRSFLVADGAIAEDLMDMRGSGQAVVRFKEYLVLFTELEIWRAIPTDDDYAFRFARTIDNVGTPWPRTIATTPEGLVFLGRDYEVYITDGTSILPLGPLDASGPSRIQQKLKNEVTGQERMWGTYNQTQNRYELYYAASDSPGGYPSRALFYSFADRTWWPQRFPFGLSAGADLIDPATLVSWDEITDSWDATTRTWDSYDVSSNLRRPNVFTSLGSTLRFRSDQTTDDGTAIDVRWKSSGLRGRGRLHLKEIWIDYENDSASSASLLLGSARSGSAFEVQGNLSLTSTNDPLFVPTWYTDFHPAFELRLNDGGLPRFSSFRAQVQEASKF